jgi:hypothetical protein
MNREDTMTDIQTGTVRQPPALGRLRHELVYAVARDQAHRRRRHRARLAALVAVPVLGAAGGAVAAATGGFSRAPDGVQQTFARLNDGAGGPAVDGSKAVQVGVIDDHAAYAAPAAHGVFCLHFAPNPRSGPSGTTCLPATAGREGIALTPQAGHDGGYVFGRVSADGAVSVDIGLPDGSTVTAPVVEDGFFLVDLPMPALEALAAGATVTATANDADGATVAQSAPTPLSLPDTPPPTTP